MDSRLEESAVFFMIIEWKKNGIRVKLLKVKDIFLF